MFIMLKVNICHMSTRQVDRYVQFNCVILQPSQSIPRKASCQSVSRQNMYYYNDALNVEATMNLLKKHRRNVWTTPSNLPLRYCFKPTSEEIIFVYCYFNLVFAICILSNGKEWTNLT